MSQRRTASGLARQTEQSHTGFQWRAASLTDVAFQTSADNVVPGGWPAATARDDVIETEMTVAEFLAAVLAAILVPQKNVPAVELDRVARHAVVIQQPDHARDLDREADGAYPVIPLAAFFDRHSPPDALPAYTVLPVGSPASTASAVMRPVTLP